MLIKETPTNEERIANLLDQLAISEKSEQSSFSSYNRKIMDLKKQQELEQEKLKNKPREAAERQKMENSAFLEKMYQQSNIKQRPVTTWLENREGSSADLMGCNQSASKNGDESSLMLRFTEAHSLDSDRENTVRVVFKDPPAKAKLKPEVRQDVYCGRGVPRQQHLDIIKYSQFPSKFEYENWEIYFSKQPLYGNRFLKV